MKFKAIQPHQDQCQWCLPVHTCIITYTQRKSEQKKKSKKNKKVGNKHVHNLHLLKTNGQMSVNTVQALYVLSDPAVFGLLCRSPFLLPEEFKKTEKKNIKEKA